jgi:tetratricopeptide (TPR) repeat protein
MATGRWIVQHQRIPFTDVLSFTAIGHEWIYPVLSQVIFYCLYQLGGYALLSWVAAAACVAATALLLQGNTLTKCLAVVAVPLIATRTAPRAELFTQLIFVAFVYVLWRYHKSGRGPLWSLPLLMFLWVNLHGGFLAGLGMCVAYVAFELGDALLAERRPAALRRLRSAAPWLLATFVATLLNPWGIRNFVGMVRLVPVHSSRWNVELMSVPVVPTSFLQVLHWRDPRSALWFFIVVAGASAVVALLQRRIAPALVCASSIYFVIHTIRFEGLFATAAVVIGGSILGDGMDAAWARSAWQRVQLAARKFRPVPISAILALALTVLVGVRIWDLVTNRYYLRTPAQFATFGPGESGWFPEEAAVFLKHERLPANVFNDFNSGGFVAWKLFPEYADYLDGRVDPFGQALYFRSSTLLGESLDSPDWQQEAESRHINTIMVSVDHELGLGLPALGTFCESQQWRPVYLDTKAALFERITASTAAQVNRLQLDCQKLHFDNPPAAAGSRGRAERFNYYLNAATILIVLNRNDEALGALDQAERLFSENPFLHYAKGIALQNIDRRMEAERELNISLQLGSSDAPLALVRLYDQQGRYAEEVALLRRVADRVPKHTLYLRLGYAQLAIGQPGQALDSFNQADKQSPFVGDAYGLGAAFREQLATGRRRAQAAH